MLVNLVLVTHGTSINCEKVGCPSIYAIFIKTIHGIGALSTVTDNRIVKLSFDAEISI